MEDYAPQPGESLASQFYDVESKAWRFPLWAENWPAIEFYLRIQTQWRVGMNGRTGLDYNVLFHEMDRRDLSRDDYDDLLDSIRVIERTVLDLD